MTMGGSITLRPYTDANAEPLLDLWQRALPLDGITRAEFERRVILDVNREPDSLMLAFREGDATPVGFLLCLVLRHPIENTGLLENRGFITAFAVDPAARRSGVGQRLLDHAEAFCHARNRKEIVLSPYTPNYFVPGVDKERYTDGLAFLLKRGFVEFSEGIAMDAMIGRFEIDEETRQKEAELAGEGIVVKPFDRSQLLEFLTFMSSKMPGPWLEDARRNLKEMTHGRFTEDSILVALDKGRLIGYCQHEHEHFGPFGVSDEYQGRGVGSVLLARTLHQMRLKGHHAAFVLWTGERAAKGVYGRLGFTISRRFALLRKVLEPTS